MIKKTTKAVGFDGEARACRYLKWHGYSILEQNFTVRFGEIDIVAKKRDTVVFVEVKTRKDASFGRACEAVDAQKQKRLISAAKLWLAKTQFDGPTRFDVIEVYLNGKLNHIENAFWCEE